MASLTFYLKRPKDESGNLKKDPVIIYSKFTLDRKHRFDLPSGEKILPRYWDTKKQQAKSQMPGHIELNQSLSRLKDQIIQLYRDHKQVDIRTFQEMCRNVIKHGQSSTPVEKKTLAMVIDLFLNQYQKEKAQKTIQKYSALRDRLAMFNPKACIEDVDHVFYDEFKAFLYKQPNPNYPDCTLINRGDYWDIVQAPGEPVGLFDETVFKYIINLKTVLAWAAARGFQVNPSYKRWEIINRTYPPISLTMSELERLENLDITPDLVRENITFKKHARKDQAEILARQLSLSRDYLVIECRTGQRISDIKRFDPSGVADFKWTLQPKKGNRLSSKRVTVHFKGYCAPALWVFQKHAYKLPTVSEQKLNENIKRVALLAGITQETTIYRWAQNKRIRIAGPKYEFISTHIGRKTFVTLALQSGMPTEMVMDLAGIDAYSTIRHYRAKSEDAVIEKYLLQMQEHTLMKKVI